MTTTLTQTQTFPKQAGAFFVETVPGTTCPGTVLPPVMPMVSLATFTRLNRLVLDKVNLAKVTAMPGMDLLVVNVVTPANEESTSVPYVAVVPIPLNSAPPPHELLVIKTPFIPDAWESFLNNITPFNPFLDVPIGLRFGFNMGVHSPPTQTYTPPNHNSALLYPDHVLSHIHNKLSHGRYSGPFSRSKLDP